MNAPPPPRSRLGIGCLRIDTALRLVDATPHALVTLECEAADLVGRHIGEVLSVRHRRERAAWLRALARGEAANDDMPAALSIGGKVRYVRLRSAPAVEGGTLLMVESLRSDSLTRRLLVEAMRWRRIVEDAELGVVVLDADDRVLDTNRCAHALLAMRSAHGVPLAEGAATGLDFYALLDAPGLRSRDRASHVETIVREERTLRVRCSPVVVPGEGRIGTVIAVVDLTPQRRLQAELERSHALSGELARRLEELHSMELELRQAQKLEAVGRLASGVAHEINTPMQYIGDNLHFLRRATLGLLGLVDEIEQIVAEPGVPPAVVAKLAAAIARAKVPRLRERLPIALDGANEGVTAVSAIVQALKSFAHPGAVQRVPVDLNAALQSTLTVSRNEWKYVAEVETRFDPDLPQVLGLPGELNQVFLNLVINAAHAIVDAGRTEDDARGHIRVETACDGDVVEVRIVDDGCGMSEAVAERVFDPFFTTKGVGRGTGQGLSIARNIVVDKHGGDLRFESTPGVGTTFVIRLPVGLPTALPAVHEEHAA